MPDWFWLVCITICHVHHLKYVSHFRQFIFLQMLANHQKNLTTFIHTTKIIIYITTLVLTNHLTHLFSNIILIYSWLDDDTAYFVQLIRIGKMALSDSYIVRNEIPVICYRTFKSQTLFSQLITPINFKQRHNCNSTVLLKALEGRRNTRRIDIHPTHDRNAIVHHYCGRSRHLFSNLIHF